MNKALACLAALSAGVVSLTFAAPADAADTIVRFELNAGANTTGGFVNSFDVRLFDTAAPETVENFLRYVQDAAYDGSVLHRLVPGFVLQGGGYVPEVEDDTIVDLVEIPDYGTISNEFGASNQRGTIAMAKLGGQPDSATSQWFINLNDNSANLDTQNGGFTVFGRVEGNGMDLIDAVATLQRYALNPMFDADGSQGRPFGQVPLFNDGSTLVTVESITVVGVVPEPATMGVVLAVAAPLALLRRRRSL